MSVVLSEHLPLLALAPDGIQKLRGLILELAVRGKLVPQDPDDEPANELLKQLKQERARLEAEGLCKKSKATPLDESERPFELPIGWEWCRFPDVANYKMGKTPPTKEAAYWAEGGIPWVSISDMNHGQRVVTTSRTISNAACEKVFRSRPAPAGTLLMSFKLTVGKVSTLDIDAFHNEAIISIFPFKGVSQEFLSHFLPMIAQGGNSKSALMGDTLNSESLALLCIPLPPLAEQHRIVAKVDELMSICNRLEEEQTDAASAHARLVESLLGALTQSTNAGDLATNWQRLAEHFDTLFTTETSIDALKQTVLQLAVLGKLVPQDPTDEPASSLLSRIELERARMVVEGKCKKSKPMPPIDESELPFHHPEGWQWARWGDITHWMTYGFTRPMPHVNSGPTILTAKNIFGGTIDFENVHFTTDEAFIALSAKDLPSDGDILITKDGSIGRAAVVPPSAPKFCINQSVAVLWLRDIPVNRSFLVNTIHSALLQERIWAAAEGAAIKHISITDFVKFPLPLPPLAEQERIVTKTDELMALCDRLKADLATTRQRQATLADTMIKSALEAA